MINGTPKAERKTLLITQVSPLEKVGDKKIDILRFKAKNENGQEQEYRTFVTQLFDLVQNGMDKRIEFDIETTENGVYINRKVTQAYQNNQPVIVKNQAFYKKSSPEERASIEAQVAVKAITELEIGGKPVIPELIKLRDEWLKSALARN